MYCRPTARNCNQSRNQKDSRSRIYTLPIEGGTPPSCHPVGPSYLHGWSPDGKQLAPVPRRNGNYDVYVIPAEGGEEVRLTTAEDWTTDPNIRLAKLHLV